jgi:hypothetical protein
MLVLRVFQPFSPGHVDDQRCGVGQNQVVRNSEMSLSIDPRRDLKGLTDNPFRSAVEIGQNEPRQLQQRFVSDQRGLGS